MRLIIGWFRNELARDEIEDRGVHSALARARDSIFGVARALSSR